MQQDATSGNADSPSEYPPEYPQRQRKQRRKSPHPGVVLLDPKKDPLARRTAWRARYVDHSGKLRKVTLEPVDAKTVRTRHAWAVKLSESLQRHRGDVKAGLLRQVLDVPLPDAVKRFFAAKPRLAARTADSYRKSIMTLVAGRERMTTGQITPEVLATWRDDRANVRVRKANKGGTRGAKAERTKLRSAQTMNKELRSVGVVLAYWRRAGMLRINTDDIKDALHKERVDRKRKPHLSREQIAQLMRACTAHDAECYELTRDGLRDVRRYEPVTPVVRLLLLTGMRVGEALAIEWSDVDADSIHIRAAITKTRHDRDVDLTVARTALPARPAQGGRVITLTAGELHAARKRLSQHGAPSWSPHALRRTCSTFFCCAFDAWRAAKSLGHSVVVMEASYAGLVKVEPGTTSLEVAMGLE